MALIALIGADGAGKTTVARKIESSCGAPIRYLYMGVNTDASNVALPTTRLGLWLKRLVRSSRGRKRPDAVAEPSSRRGGVGRTARAAARLANLLADEWYRQGVAWWHRMRGYTVLCDRYYLFDYNRHLNVEGQERLLFRLHRYLLEKLYPRPALVIFLDAPARVLFERKREGTVESLEARRQAFLQLGRELPNFVRIDATRPLPEVCREVLGKIERVAGRRRSGPSMSKEVL